MLCNGDQRPLGALGVMSLNAARTSKSTVSFNPRDTPASATAKKRVPRTIPAARGRRGMYFLTGDQRKSLG
jgi:hypothetical protein